MDPIKSIGKFLHSGEQRDAIHVAILPVTTSEDMSPGESVKLIYGTTDSVARAGNYNGIGVIDPFLSAYIPKGSRVWLFLKPGTITGLRHEWAHPEVDDQPVSKSESEEWLRAFASKWNFSYNEMIRGAQEDGGYVVADGIDLHSRSELDPGDEMLFWEHIKALTGFSASDEHKSDFGWSCSC